MTVAIGQRALAGMDAGAGRQPQRGSVVRRNSPCRSAGVAPAYEAVIDPSIAALDQVI
jgi:hypothetical protein